MPVSHASSAHGVHPTRYWHRLPDGRVQCDTCPRFCQLRPGKRGACYVRMHAEHGPHAGEIVLTSYGRASGFCIDPVEKKPLNHFYPGSPVLSFGTAGCNLSCEFCQNWRISKSRSDDTLAADGMPDAVAALAHSKGCRSVAFTYNDPVVFQEYAVDTAIACHRLGVRSVAVSAGYHCPAPRADFYRHMDAANIDLKGFTNRFYRQLCHGALAPVLDTLLWLRHETTVWLEITTLLIPGQNDSDQELSAMCHWLAQNLGPDVPHHFTAFHPDFHLREIGRTPASTLNRARRIAQDAGLHYVYTGNIADSRGNSSWCPGCGALLIERVSYQHRGWYLKGAQHNRCPGCQRLIPGKFTAGPDQACQQPRPVAAPG